jgi:hypothetical protein
LRIAFKLQEILKALFASPEFSLESLRVSLGKPLTNRVLTGVTEWRIAKVMDQATSRSDSLNLTIHTRFNLFLGQQISARRDCKPSSHRRDFKRVGQARPDGIMGLQRKHLSLVLQPLEGRRENRPIMVSFKLFPPIT